MVLSADSFRYDGKAKKPSVTVIVGNTKLSANTDYSVSYNNYTKAGNATVTVKGKGNYTGVVKKTYRIFVAQDIEKGEIILSESSFVYDGTEKTTADSRSFYRIRKKRQQKSVRKTGEICCLFFLLHKQ